MLSPSLARWLSSSFENVDAYSAQFLGYLGVEDRDIAEDARKEGAVILTKDSDFADEVRRKGSPPVILVRTSNSTNAVMRRVLGDELPAALAAIHEGSSLVEVGA